MSTFSRFLKTYYAYRFLFDFIFCYAIYAAFFSIKGLTIFEIGLLLAFWSGSAILLEVFTGAFSDWFDRRWLLIAAPLLKALTFVSWAMADGNFWVFGLGFFFWSFGGSLESGTQEALLYERTAHEGKQQSYDEYYGKGNAAAHIGNAVGTLLGGFIAHYYGMQLTFWLSIIPLLLCAYMAMHMPDTRHVVNDEKTPINLGYWQNISNAFAEFKNLSELRFITLYLAIGLVFFEELEEFDTIYYLLVGLPVWLFGVVAAFGLGLGAILSAQAHRFSGHQSLAWILIALGGVLFIISSFANHPAYVVILELAYIIIVPARIMAEARFQQILKGDSRATTTSLFYFFENIMGLSIGVTFGFIADWIGLLPTYGYFGAFLLPISAWVWWMIKRGHRPFT